jgi:ABC-type spermidine/putrescine transport system permease subunit I
VGSNLHGCHCGGCGGRLSRAAAAAVCHCTSITPPAEEIRPVPTLANFTRISESFSDFKILLWNSLVFSIGSSAWALVFGTALAWLAERTNARFRGVALLFTDSSSAPTDRN